MDRISEKYLLGNKGIVFKNKVKTIQATAYNGACTIMHKLGLGCPSDSKFFLRTATQIGWQHDWKILLVTSIKPPRPNQFKDHKSQGLSKFPFLSSSYTLFWIDYLSYSSIFFFFFLFFWTMYIYSIKQNDEIRNFQWAASMYSV